MPEQSDPSGSKQDRAGRGDAGPGSKAEPAAAGKGGDPKRKKAAAGEGRRPGGEPTAGKAGDPGGKPTGGEGRNPGGAPTGGANRPSADDPPHGGLTSMASLERLRDRVEVAAQEMKRLREENRALADRIRELETRPAVDPQSTLLTLDHDPELLKRKITGFIEAIDSYLERERNRT